MMHRFTVFAFVLTLLLSGACSKAQRNGEVNDPFVTYGVAAAYANSSHNIFAALTQDRKVFDASATIDWRIGRPRHYTYRWEVEILPIFLARNPREVLDISYTTMGQPPSTIHIDELIAVPCRSEHDHYIAISSTGPPITVDYSSVCTQQFTYGGGISPLGQRLNFRPGQRLQPFIQANAGFILFTRAVPTVDASAFNFTAELGGGIEFFRTPHHSVALELVYHHLSNGGRGDSNPAIENYLLKLAYRFNR